MKRRRGDGEVQNQNQNQNPPKESKNEVSNFLISALPAYLLLEILARLPIAAVMNCKLVCKTWHKLLTESSFTDYYGKNSSLTHLLLPLSRHLSDPSSQLLYLLEISKNGNCIQRPIKLKLPVWVERRSSEFVIGSCNGLIILTLCRPGADLIYISDPLTGGCIELPKHKRDRNDMGMVFYKIGFCPSTDKFKVLRFAYKTWNDSKIDKCAILTVGVDEKWRRLSCPYRKWGFSADWICVNGDFHWIVEGNGSSWISTFDLAEEKFGRVSHPPGVVLDSEDMELALFNNRLTLVDFSSASQIALWTMNDIAFAKTWTKDVILMRWFPSVVRVAKLFPVGKLRNGDILFGDSAHLIYINVKRKTCSKIEDFRYPKINSSIMAYTPRFRSFREAIMEGNGSAMHVQSK